MINKQYRRDFFSSLFSSDRLYPSFKILSSFFSILSGYFVVVTLAILLNDIIYEKGRDIFLRDLATVLLVFLLLKVVLFILDTTLSARKTKIIEYDRNRKNSLFSKMPLFLYEGEEVQRLMTNLNYLEKNGSTSISKLMDSPLSLISYSVSAGIEILLIIPLFRIVETKEVFISILFVILYVSAFIIASKLKARYLHKGVESFSNEGHKKLRKLASHIDYQYDVKINPDIRFYNNKLLKEGAEEECEISRDVFSSYWKNISKGSFFSTFFKTISFFLGLIFVAYSAYKGKISIGSIFVYSSLLENLTQHIEKAMFQYNVMTVGDDYLLKREKLKDISTSTKGKEITESKRRWKTIVFRNVSYSYPNTDRKIFDGFNLVLNHNESTALVGLNGSGKSTFIQLLFKFRKPDRGEILLDGRDIWMIDDNEYRSLFSPLLQDSSLLSFPLKDNLVLEDDKQYEELTNLLKVFGLSDIDLYKESGLSGGQERRVLFIRALIHSDRYMVLDEPSSASDPECESLIFKHLETRDGYLLVTHSISMLKMITRIIVIKDGKGALVIDKVPVGKNRHYFPF